MEIKIRLGSCLIYEDKETKAKKTRLGYTMVDKSYLQNTEKFKGYPELSAFYDNDTIITKIPADYFGEVVIAFIESKPSARNPLKEYKQITKLKLGNNVVDLV